MGTKQILGYDTVFILETKVTCFVSNCDIIISLIFYAAEDIITVTHVYVTSSINKNVSYICKMLLMNISNG